MAEQKWACQRIASLCCRHLPSEGSAIQFNFKCCHRNAQVDGDGLENQQKYVGKLKQFYFWESNRPRPQGQRWHPGIPERRRCCCLMSRVAIWWLLWKIWSRCASWAPSCGDFTSNWMPKSTQKSPKIPRDELENVCQGRLRYHAWLTVATRQKIKSRRLTDKHVATRGRCSEAVNIHISSHLK